MNSRQKYSFRLQEAECVATEVLDHQGRASGGLDRLKPDRSRLIIKNLPHSLSSNDKLKAHFDTANLGTITDSRIATKRDGTFRGIGFIGYKTSEEALKAKEFFGQTFVERRRIQVEIVDANKAREGSSSRPAKRPRQDFKTDCPSGGTDSSSRSSAIARSSTLSNSTRLSKSMEFSSRREQQLSKFLELMGPRSTANSLRAWCNEEDFGRSETQLDNKWQVGEGRKLRPENRSGAPSGEMSDVEWRKNRMENASTSLLEEDEDQSIFQQPNDQYRECIRDDGLVDILAEPNVIEPPSPEEAELGRATTQILTTGRLFLRNLTYSCSEEDLRDSFSKYGEIEHIHILVDSRSHRSKGTAYIRYSKPREALAAFEAMDGKDLQGRLVHILPALDPPSAKPVGNVEDVSPPGKSVKETTMIRKENAGKDFNWAMLYMNSDAVVCSIADRMRISKADILNSENGATNPAVKLALAETHVIQETKKYLEESGICLDAFQPKGHSQPGRSNTVILVKNIPYGTSTSDLQNLFGMHGQVKKLLIPPAGTIAVVEFEHTDEAKRAFKGVAYKRMKNSIVYLEWAPEGVFKEEGEGKGKGKVVDSGVVPVKIAEQERSSQRGVEGNGEDIITGDEAPGATLFVKNLNFSTTLDQLTSAFKSLPGFTFARINNKLDPKSVDGTRRLSMGFGFVGFASPAEAKKALKTMQGFVLDGYPLLVTFAKRDAGEQDEQTSRGQGGHLLLGETKSAKIIVRNVPFEASKKDLKELFGAHGTLKSIRLPKKLDSRSRGFAFLEFVSRREAENAMGTLKHTHLLGRHLVLEWAKEKNLMDVDELREKVKKSYVEEGKVLSGRKRKFRMEGDVQDGEGEEVSEVAM
ncbi:Multiple RNA-binding domain-containing protein 1 [Tulasnella sp. UAMH 9824]|nr:Multiple RNA-binding domain-containing protein 1 [Tulasnella sp. UAMH 9824]